MRVPSNRRLLIWTAAIVGAAFMISMLTATLRAQRDSKVLDAELQTIEKRQVMVSTLLDDLTQVETSERGFLLTEDPRYLGQYTANQKPVFALVNELVESYRPAALNGITVQQVPLRNLRTLVGAKMGEMQETIALYAKSGRDTAIALVHTDVGLDAMAAIRNVLGQLSTRDWSVQQQLLRELSFTSRRSSENLVAATIVIILLILVAAMLIDRELRRTEEEARMLERHAETLEREVQARTKELAALSSHLQDVAEREKSALARELHDELGGLLVAAKMDLSWLERHVTVNDGGTTDRWKRIRDALDQGVNLKRRLVENLRPTLLDTMGLVPALQWVFQETCGRAGLKCTESLPDRELQLDDHAAITIFRVAQEAFTNIVKHARATEADLQLAIDGDDLVLRVFDNGIGITDASGTHYGHGLAGMRHRLVSVAGKWSISTPPTGGTEVIAQLPLKKTVAAARPSGAAWPLPAGPF
jgi:signal transduction histidine kinase